MEFMDASAIVRSGFPPDEGKKLAEFVLGHGIDLNDLGIDLCSCTAGLLISSFFNGFLQTIADRNPGHLEAARKIRWKTEFSFQDANIRRWMADFKPYSPSRQSSAPPQPKGNMALR